MDEIKVCAICGETLEDDREVIETSEGEFVHYDCIIDDDNYSYCEECEQWHPTDEMEYVHGRRGDGAYVCKDCCENSLNIFMCECCEEYYFSREISQYEAATGEIICEYCDENHYSTCEDCGGLYHEDDLHWNDDVDGYLCNDCTQTRDRNKAKIHNYGYKPDPVFKSMTLHDRFIVSSDITEPTLGVELEIDKGHDRFDCAEELVDASEDIYCKEDGSLTCGIEIVSHPATLDYHLEGLGWDKLIDIATKYDYKSHDARTCGLHVHVGREQLGKDVQQRNETITKIMLFIVRHWNNVVKFTRRDNSQLSRWAKLNNFRVDTSSKDTTVKNAMETRWNGRYQAINLENGATIEFRIFNGTLKKETLYATLQFVNNLCKWAKETSFERVYESKWSDVQHYVDYTELNEYCIARDIDERDVKDFPKPIKIGDRVRILRRYDALNGFEGVVAAIAHDSRDYGVRFDSLSEDAALILDNMDFLHDLSGALETRIGRFYSVEEIEVIEEA